MLKVIVGISAMCVCVCEWLTSDLPRAAVCDNQSLETSCRRSWSDQFNKIVRVLIFTDESLGRTRASTLVRVGSLLLVVFFFFFFFFLFQSKKSE